MLINGGKAAWVGLLIIVAVFAVLVAPPGTAEKPELDAIPYRDAIQDFSLYDLDGVVRHSKDYRGKTLLVFFWLIDCQTCHADIAELEVAYQQLKDEPFEVLAIHAGARLDKVKGLPGIDSISYTVLMDMDLKMGDWGVPAIPTAYVVDRNGYRRYRSVGARDWSSPEMIAALRRIANLPDETHD